jgi:hypothetical protein
MSLSKPELSGLCLRPFTDSDLVKRPRQVHDTQKYFQWTIQELGQSMTRETSCVLSHKADGWSGTLTFNAWDRMVVLSFRKHGAAPAIPPLPAQTCLTKVAGDYASIQLHVEIVACLHGDTRRELGHALVPSAIKAFVANGCKNQGPLHMRLRVFGLCSFRLMQGNTLTARNDPFKFIAQLVRHGNDLLDIVEHVRYNVKLTGGNLTFREQTTGKLVACTHDAFVEYALGLAASKRYEGWVLQFAEEHFVYTKSEGRAWKCPPTEEDPFGKPRERCKLKIKQLPQVHALAVKVNNAETDEMAIWLYGRNGSKTDPTRTLRYLADVTDHPIITGGLNQAGKTVGVNYSSEEEKQRAYKPTLANVINAGVPFKVEATSLTTRGFLSGVKITNTHRMPTTAFAELSNADELLADNPHALAVKACVQEYHEILAARKDDAETMQALEYGASNPFTPIKPAARKQKKPREAAVARSPSPPAKVQRASTPEKPAAPPVIIAHDAVILLDSAVFGPTAVGMFKARLAKRFPTVKFAARPGPSVTVVVSLQRNIGFMNGPCRCSDIKLECHPGVKFVAKEELDLLLAQA